jgi:GNAT superfamily N-acetyltransferase
MKYTIRLATPADLDPMLEWRGDTEAMRVALRAEFADLAQGKSTIWIAFSPDDRQIGTVQILFMHKDCSLTDRYSAYLQALEVREEFRGEGIGTMLVSTIERYAKSSGYTRLTLMVEPNNIYALAFYQRLGFQIFRHTIDTWDGQTDRAFCLEKDLTVETDGVGAIDR